MIQSKKNVQRIIYEFDLIIKIKKVIKMILVYIYLGVTVLELLIFIIYEKFIKKEQQNYVLLFLIALFFVFILSIIINLFIGTILTIYYKYKHSYIGNEEDLGIGIFVFIFTLIVMIISSIFIVYFSLKFTKKVLDYKIKQEE